MPILLPFSRDAHECLLGGQESLGMRSWLRNAKAVIDEGTCTSTGIRIPCGA